uniref:Uncharacterized protein n=1 Tax=Mesocestoides corti TaxID=53468 RepID=A0A5K3EQG9_MESCO
MPSPRQVQWGRSSRTQPSTPGRRRRDIPSTPNSGGGSGNVARRHVLQSQTSVTIDQPIDYTGLSLEEEDEEEEEEEEEGSSGTRRCLYTSYLRRRLKETRPCSMDEGKLECLHTINPRRLQRSNASSSRAMSFENPYYEESEGESWRIMVAFIIHKTFLR